MPIARKRQPRPKPRPYNRQKASTCATPKDGLPSRPAKPGARPTAKTKRRNLALNDWLTVFAHVDAHPDLSQAQVVEFFKTRPQGRLEFTQASLSRKLKARDELEERVRSNPNALSSKRPRVVTRPDVEEALVLWIRSVETEGRVVNRPTLREERQRLEAQMNVPEEERLTGDGWIAPFCRAYDVKQHRRRGEAGSADREIADAEGSRVSRVVPKLATRDPDESDLVPMAPPDCDLATKRVEGTVMDAEGDAVQTTEAVGKAAAAASQPTELHCAPSKPPRLDTLEQDSDKSLAHAVGRNQIFEPPLTCINLPGLPDQKENANTEAAHFEDDAANIVEARRREAIGSSDLVEESNTGRDDNDDEPRSLTLPELIECCEKLEAGYISRVAANASLDVLHHLRALRATFRRQEMENAKQTVG